MVPRPLSDLHISQGERRISGSRTSEVGLSRCGKDPHGNPNRILHFFLHTQPYLDTRRTAGQLTADLEQTLIGGDSPPGWSRPLNRPCWELAEASAARRGIGIRGPATQYGRGDECS